MLSKKKKNVKDSVETFVYYVGNGFSIPRHFAKDYDLVFKLLRLLVLSKLYCLLETHFFLNWDSLHARLNSHYAAWGYKKKKQKD